MKKVYKLIAQGLKDSKPPLSDKYSTAYHALLVQWNLTVENIAYHLAKSDDKFHRNTFLTDCGYLPE